jgi:integrase
MIKNRFTSIPIYLNPKTVEAVKAHIRYNKISDGWLFPCNSNNGIGQALTTRSIQLLVTGILKHLFITKSCHSFRHFFVTELIKVYKSDLSRVMSYSRHKSLSMLTVYNDAIQQKQDLPRFFRTFKAIDF